MKDSCGPLKALAVASVVNGVGDVVLCLFFNYGIAGAAWATMASQIVAGFMMIESLKDKGYIGYAIAVPSANELLQIFKLAAPVFMMMMSKVLIQIYSMFIVGGEPLSQTAQSFMPELIYGAKRSLSKVSDVITYAAIFIIIVYNSYTNFTYVVVMCHCDDFPHARMLLKSLVIIGATCGLILGVAGTIVPWLSPKVFSPDPHAIKKMHTVLLPHFIALSVTACTHSLEGTLLAGRDLRFISVSMTTIFTLGGLLLLLFSNLGFGLPGCWWTLALFQWSRFTIALLRLISPNGILYSEDMTRYELGKASTT
ncbi:putative multi antimicrobial extrusion protein DinF [Helianthus annuus]|nr:putative multi antimicrobial extrusion protein DinF [Helianthus annuus]